MKALTWIVLIFVNAPALAQDFKLPFSANNVELPKTFSALILTPTAVENSRFHAEIQKDCTEFQTQLKKWQSEGLQLSAENFHELRKMPLALSMKPDYQISLSLKLDLSETSPLETFELNLKALRFKFSKDSLTPLFLQKKYKDDVILVPNLNGLSLTFKSRDLFCDYQAERLKIEVVTDLKFKIEDRIFNSLHKRLDGVSEDLNYSIKSAVNPQVQAAIFGYLAAERFDVNLKNYIETAFTDLLEANSMSPATHWLQKQENLFSVHFSKEQSVNDQKITLKRVMYE